MVSSLFCCSCTDATGGMLLGFYCEAAVYCTLQLQACMVTLGISREKRLVMFDTSTQWPKCPTMLVQLDKSGLPKVKHEKDSVSDSDSCLK